MEKLSTERFSDRVDNYVRYRPGYPRAIIDMLHAECGLDSTQPIADIASGTGIFTRLLLENGNPVFAVEPNAEMRAASQPLQREFAKLTLMDGTAEKTELPDASVNFITVAQAAHWFDPEKTRKEFERILKPNGWCVLLWNERSKDGNAFLEEYEKLLQDYCPEYKDKRHGKTRLVAQQFFPEGFEERIFQNDQRFDFEGLKGRLLSSSYSPLPGEANYQPMMRELERIFQWHAENDQVQLSYDTRVYLWYCRCAPNR